MRVIFLHDVPRVGRKNEVKEVNGGYAMNFLLPRKLAVLASPKALAELEERKKEITLGREVQGDLLLKNLEEIKDKVVTISAKANEKGHLFSAIHVKQISDALESQHRISINEEYIDLPKALKEIGEFEIPIKVKDKKSSFKLVISAM